MEDVLQPTHYLRIFMRKTGNEDCTIALRGKIFLKVIFNHLLSLLVEL
jgi:hypothetical protein